MFQPAANASQFALLRFSYAAPSQAVPHGCLGGGKRAIDILLGILLLLLLALPMLLVATCIRLESPGPILFRQRRVGYGNAPSRC